MSADFAASVEHYTARIDEYLNAVMPAAGTTPARLHDAMRYAVFNGGKRLRPLMVYATGECIKIEATKLDPLAAAIELIHAFSLVHDDLPAMDDDDLRRGQPTLHRAYDEATAILAADALQPLAFRVIAESECLTDAEKCALVRVVAVACGSLGMTGGQSIDLASEGRRLSLDELQEMHALKTGALLRACIVGCCDLTGNLDERQKLSLTTFAEHIGLAFQIRDDILDVEGDTDIIGKPAGSDQQRDKATWPALFGLDESRRRCVELTDESLQLLSNFGEGASVLRRLTRYVADRET